MHVFLKVFKKFQPSETICEHDNVLRKNILDSWDEHT